jgi:hypothetical protein
MKTPKHAENQLKTPRLSGEIFEILQELKCGSDPARAQ